MNLLQHSLVLAIRAYRCTVSPAQLYLFGAGSGCRFTPTCSAYGLEAISTHGALFGSWLTLKRICRCHPWGGCGHDPVPDRARPGRSDAANEKVSGNFTAPSEGTGIITGKNRAISSFQTLTGHTH